MGINKKRIQLYATDLNKVMINWDASISSGQCEAKTNVFGKLGTLLC